MGTHNFTIVPRVAHRLDLKIYRVRLAQMGCHPTPGAINRRYYRAVFGFRKPVSRNLFMSQMLLDGINDATAWGAFVALLCSAFVVVLVPTLAAGYGAVKVYRLARRANWNAVVLRVLRRALVGLLFASAVYGQGVNTGNETVVSYSGTNAQLVAPNTPITNFNTGTGTTTFILPVANPAVSLRVYITNNTANACSGFTIQMFSATDSVTNTFNGALTNWQTVLLQNPAGGLSAILTLNIPASGAVYVTSSAIQAPKVAIQLVNAANCTNTTLVEVTAVVASVTLSVPLISTNGPNPSSSVGNGVQGVQPEGFNGNTINPVMVGGASLPTNGGFLLGGLDGLTTGFVEQVVTTQTMNLGFTPAASQGSNELALGLATTTGCVGGESQNLPWVTPGVGGGAGTQIFSYSPAVTGTPLIVTCAGSLGFPANWLSTIMTFKTGTMRQNRAGGAGGIGFISPTLAGSLLGIFMNCATPSGTGLPCTATVSDTLGLTWQQLAAVVAPNTAGNSGLVTFLSTSASPGGNDTITLTMTGGTTLNQAQIFEISNPTPSSLNLPTTVFETDTTGRIVTAPDAQQPNLWVCTITLSTNTTTLCQTSATTINGIAARSYVSDYQINTTTAGTATTIQLITGTGTNCGTGTANLSAIAFPNTTVAITSAGPFRSALFTPLQSEVCVKQAGTTAGTSVIEVHGFYAP